MEADEWSSGGRNGGLGIREDGTRRKTKEAGIREEGNLEESKGMGDMRKLR